MVRRQADEIKNLKLKLEAAALLNEQTDMIPLGKSEARGGLEGITQRMKSVIQRYQQVNLRLSE